jgi:hypothetical protein
MPRVVPAPVEPNSCPLRISTLRTLVEFVVVTCVLVLTYLQPAVEVVAPVPPHQ